MTEVKKMAALLQTDATTEALKNRTPTKRHVVLLALANGSLNRFEAERRGEHCLNSTVAELRHSGVTIVDEWETVPTRGARGETRVKRYWCDPGPKNMARVWAMLGEPNDGR